MTDVQLEHGYTRIANDLLEALIRSPIPGRHKDVLLAVIRLTYGYGLTKRQMGSMLIAGLVGIGDRRVRMILGDLEKWKMIHRTSVTIGQRAVIGVVKDFEQWSVGATNQARQHECRNRDPEIVEPGSQKDRPMEEPALGRAGGPALGRAGGPALGRAAPKENFKNNSKENSMWSPPAAATAARESPQGDSESPPKRDTHPESSRLAQLLRDELLSHVEDWTPPRSLDAWTTEFDRMLRLDGPQRSGIPPDHIECVIRWVVQDDFESANVQSAKKLRQRFAQLHVKANGARASPTSRTRLDIIADEVEKSRERDRERRQRKIKRIEAGSAGDAVRSLS